MPENEQEAPPSVLIPPPPPNIPTMYRNPMAMGWDMPLPGLTNQNAEFVDKMVRSEIPVKLLQTLPEWVYASFINKISALSYLNEKDEVFLKGQINDLKMVALNRTPITIQSVEFLMALNSLYQFAFMAITRSREGKERNAFITNLSSATIEHRGAPSGDMIQTQGNPRPSGGIGGGLKKFFGGGK